MSDPRTDEDLRRMLEAIHRIQAYLEGFDRHAFDLDTRTQDAVIRNLEVIGEVAHNILQHDPGFVATHPDIPWALAYRIRTALGHGYALMELGTIWDTARTDLPEFEKRLIALLASN